ncbi:surface-adhesin E family protein [Sediminicoccus sp. BL-A-41-H5]|uniref:surface-adhesin E family protein n=1 Tax=Sediminicoccus sp. BL-A-41-H5 TaxID=3421106 RepID=UPI003D672F25
MTMPVTRLAVLLLLLTGCAAVAPAPVATPEPAPAPAAVQATAAQPSLALAPRRQWRRIPLTRGARMSEAFIASEIVTNPDGTRRVWMVINLLEPIRLPETGGYARSGAYLADFRCDPHAWNPIQGVWYTQRNAVGEALREQERGPGGIRDVGEGTFMDLFVNAACGTTPARRRR